MSDVVPVVLCGGAGTRLWPASRSARPKPLLDLLGDGSLLHTTLERARALTPKAPWLVGAAGLEQELRRGAGARARLLLEPAGRGTAPAVAAVALQTAAEDPLLLVLPSDHHVADQTALAAAVTAGATLAREGRFVVFGVRPTHPATGFGWIVPGAPVPGGHAVARFVEKPDAARAEGLLAQGGLWNAGIFLVRARVLLEELEAHAAPLLAAVRAALPSRSGATCRLGPAFLDSPDLALDVAVAERTTRAAVVPLDAGWSDLGTWQALWEASPHDTDGNATHGDVVAVGSSGNLVRAEHRLVAVAGLHDHVVVETADAVLVVPRAASEQTRAVVGRLADAARAEAASAITGPRPWGQARLLDAGPGWAVKRLEVRPGEALSLQVHAHRAERWVVVSGTPAVELDGVVRTLAPGEVVEVPAGCAHRLVNDGTVPACLVEVQLGSPDEADIVRLDDRYGRPTTSLTDS
ncbi:MAG: mannose-1-phosphate guanylyltransferase/mannose-6-phosphate isomerase [Alphaproteobacteria bacterium]|nr:mannose-1-phosphate guanylyltransferase/mannose-6-phosphate isomerase [Alphaproteobacteria bacterium]